MVKEQTPQHIRLYGTTACHLCEEAAAMLFSARETGLDFELESVDISESDELFERYGLRIPVLRRSDGAELDWPFQPERLLRFLAT